MKLIKSKSNPKKTTLSKLVSIGSKKKKLNDDDLVSFITMQDIDSKINNKIDRAFKEVKKGFSYFKNNDILVAKITPCFENGKGAIANNLTNGVGFGSTEFMVLSDYNGLGIENFVKYVTQNKRFRKIGAPQMIGGGGQRRIPKDFVLNYPIIDVNVDSYILIGKALAQQEEQVNKIKSLIKKLEKRNQYYAERLLSGELRVREGADGELEFYEDDNSIITDINGRTKRIPNKWNIEQIGSNQLSILGSGLDLFENEKKYFATGEVGYLNDYQAETEIITYLNRTSRANMQPKENSVWFARMQYTNKFLSFEKGNEKINEVVLSTGFAGILVGDDFNLDFVKHFIMTEYFITNKDLRCQGATQKAINNKSLKTLSILKPDLKEQSLISNILNTMTEEKNKVEKLLKKEQKRFDWMSDALLSGEYQIVD